MCFCVSGVLSVSYTHLQSSDAKELALKKIPAAWEYMIKHILPPLRRVELTINYGAGSIVCLLYTSLWVSENATDAAKKYKMTQDIDMTGKIYTPIGFGTNYTCLLYTSHGLFVGYGRPGDQRTAHLPILGDGIERDVVLLRKTIDVYKRQA